MCCFAVMGVLYVAQPPVWTTRTISPELSTPHVGRRRCTSRRCRPRARRVCVGSRRPSADVPTCRPRRSREGTRTRETCWNLVPRPPRTGCSSGTAEDADVRRTLRYDGVATTAATSSPSGAWRWRYRSRRLDAHPRPGDRKVRARFPPEAPFSDFPTRNNGARRVESSPNVFPDPLRSRLPRSPPRTSSPIPSAHVFPDPLRSRLTSPLTRPYYCNTRTREVSWDSPASVAPATPLEISLLFDDSRARLDADVPRRDAAKREPRRPRRPRCDAENEKTPNLHPSRRTYPLAREAHEARRSVCREPAVALAARAAPIRHQTVVGVCRRRRASRDDARRRSTRTRTRIRNVRRFRRGRVPRRARSYAFESGDANGFGTCPTALPRGGIVARGARWVFWSGVWSITITSRRASRPDASREREYRLRTARGYRERVARVSERLSASNRRPSASNRRPSASARGRASSIILGKDGRARGRRGGRATERRRRTVGGGAKTGGGVRERARARRRRRHLVASRHRNEARRSAISRQRRTPRRANRPRANAR